MNPSWILLLTLIAASMLVGLLVVLIHDLFFRYRHQLRERVNELTGKEKGDTNASLFKDLKQFDADVSSARTHWRTRLHNFLEQADLQIRLPVLLGISLAVGAVLALVAALLTKHLWAAPLGLVAGLVAPVFYVRLKYRLRIHRLAQQLPEAFDAIGRAVRAGQTISAAFQIVGDDFEPPISEEFRRCYEEQNLGMPHETALRNFAARTGIMELRILVVALLVQSRSGGNLAELLSNLSMMVRKRVKLAQKVKALTGEGRMQATVLIVLPVLAFVGLLVVSPQYAKSLTDRPSLLIAAGAAQFVGAVWIRRIAHFEF